MEKRKWPWKKKSSEKSGGESESSESISSHSERFSEDQEAIRASANEDMQSPEVTSEAKKIDIDEDDEVKESVKILTEKLSAALVNVGAKEELVKQHSKVAEEAVAGWEKAENEVAAVKQQLDVAVQQNLSLDVKNSHLDGALKECVRQLRQARDEQEKRIADALAETSRDWEAKRADFERRILDLEKENSSLKHELVSCRGELEVVAIERDLSTRAAETASKVHLESIKKVAKLEAECRRLQSVAHKSPPLQFKNEIPSSTNKSIAACSLEIDMMDDFLEMERLAARESVSEQASSDEPVIPELDSMTRRVADLENTLEKSEAERSELQIALDETLDALKAAESRSIEAEIRCNELQNELAAVYETNESLEYQLGTMEEESRTMSSSIDSLKAELEVDRNISAEIKTKCRELESELASTIHESELHQTELRNELTAAYETKESLESQLNTMTSSVDSLKSEIEEERKLSAQLTTKCQELESELTRIIREFELQQSTHTNNEPKVKQEDLAVAADKLAECQKTIASLGRQLQSLATLEDFFIDTSSIPGFSRDPSSSDIGELWRLPSNGDANGNKDSIRSSSSTAAKNWNSFGKFFVRSKSVADHYNGQE
ncbi:filament-like plant protein 3 isoform X2 [Salvia hispanica]|uniref:filament-like plant protein 3 isoform X2 n=1 Tax=Salvia hispanica TaxID=49212 RepID=UPI002009B368|nr:filament-like plant protein 3 isoform X2 [Salvia hispanica]